MKATKKLAALFCAALITLTMALPALAAQSKRPAVLHIDPAQVETITMIDRTLHVGYNVTGINDRKAILDALNTLEYRPNTNAVPSADDLRLLQIRFKDGSKYEYWCHRNVLMANETILSDGLASADLYKTLSACQKNYPANAEWLAFMNPYRITEMEIESAAKTVRYSASQSETQRNAILDVAAKLKAVKVGSVRKLDTPVSGAAPYGEGNLNYVITMDFEKGTEGYEVLVFDDGRITVSVDSISYDLTYLSADQPLFKALTDELKAYTK